MTDGLRHLQTDFDNTRSLYVSSGYVKSTTMIPTSTIADSPPPSFDKEKLGSIEEKEDKRHIPSASPSEIRRIQRKIGWFDNEIAVVDSINADIDCSQISGLSLGFASPTLS